MIFTTVQRLGVLFTTLLIVTTCVGIYVALNATGFCYSKARFLSEPERQRAFLQTDYLFWEDAHDGHRISAFDDDYFKRLKLPDFASSVPYVSLDEFLANNPDCCHIINSFDDWFRFAGQKYGVGYSDGLKKIPIHYFLAGIAHEKLLVRAQARYKNRSGEVRLFESAATYWIDNCGTDVIVPLEYISG